MINQFNNRITQAHWPKERFQFPQIFEDGQHVDRNEFQRGLYSSTAEALRIADFPHLNLKARNFGLVALSLLKLLRGLH